MLEPFDLGPTDELLYLTLIDAPSLTVADLSALAGISGEAVLELLAPLEEAGLVVELPPADGAGRRYAAIEPSVGLATLLSRREREIRHAEQRAELARATADQLAERFRMRGARHPIDRIEVVVGRDAIINRIHQLERAARRVFRGIDMPPYLMTTNEPEADMLGRGVASRWLYDDSVLDLPGKLAEIGSFSRIGEEGRVVAHAPFKLVIADETSALITLTDEPTGRHSALMVGPSALLDGLVRVFDGLWRFAVPLQPSAADPTADRPTDQESQLLTLLAVGMTDKTIARRLDLGLRTVQKRVHDLMRRLDVDTRFQAGVQARARGWL